jgi:hypothetical protein
MESLATALSIILISLFQRLVLFDVLYDWHQECLDRTLCGVVFLERCEDVSIAKIDAGGRTHCFTERWRRCLQDLFEGQHPTNAKDSVTSTLKKKFGGSYAS